MRIRTLILVAIAVAAAYARGYLSAVDTYAHEPVRRDAEVTINE